MWNLKNSTNELIYKNRNRLTDRKQETVADFVFVAAKSLPMVIAAMKLKDAYSLERKL